MSGTLAVAAVVMATYVPYAEAFIVSGTAALARLQARPLRASGSARATSMCESGGSQQALHGAMSRRQLLLGAAAAGAQSTLFSLPAQAEGASGIFKDADRGFFFSPPAGWDQAEGEFPGANRNPARPKIMSWINPEAKEVNLALVSYSIRPDYSKIGSLGNMEAVARTITGAGAGEDKPLDAEMFEQIERGNSYYFDYRIKVCPSGEPAMGFCLCAAEMWC